MGRGVREYDSDHSDSDVQSPPDSPPQSPPESPPQSPPRSPEGSPPRSMSPTRDPNQAVVVDSDLLPTKRGRAEEDRRERRLRRMEEDEAREKRREEERERRRAKDKERREKERERREERRRREEERREERKKKEEARREEQTKKEEEKKEKQRLAKELAAAKKAANAVTSSKFVKVENIDRSVTPKHLEKIFAMFDAVVVSAERSTMEVKPALLKTPGAVAATEEDGEKKEDAVEDPAPKPTSVILDDVVVKFETEEQADAAVTGMHQGHINGRKVRVCLIRDPALPPPEVVLPASIANPQTAAAIAFAVNAGIFATPEAAAAAAAALNATVQPSVAPAAPVVAAAPEAAPLLETPVVEEHKPEEVKAE